MTMTFWISIYLINQSDPTIELEYSRLYCDRYKQHLKWEDRHENLKSLSRRNDTMLEHKT
jgi:hypothetical protein